MIPVEPVTIAHAAAVGLGATVFTDLWGVFATRVFGLPPVNYCVVGRWVAHMGGGVFRHASIAAARKKAGECALGWLVHYGIGATFGLMMAAAASPGWLADPMPLPALAFGLVTIALPFLVMQPALGFGIAGSRTPRPAQARLRSLINHAVFGLGLYVAAVAVRAVL